MPLKLRSHVSIQSIVVSIMFLSGDIESNPGPAVSTVPLTHHVSGLNIGCVDAYSAINKAALLHIAQMMSVNSTFLLSRKLGLQNLIRMQ